MPPLEPPVAAWGLSSKCVNFGGGSFFAGNAFAVLSSSESDGSDETESSSPYSCRALEVLVFGGVSPFFRWFCSAVESMLVPSSLSSSLAISTASSNGRFCTFVVLPPVLPDLSPPRFFGDSLSDSAYDSPNSKSSPDFFSCYRPKSRPKSPKHQTIHWNRVT